MTVRKEISGPRGNKVAELHHDSGVLEGICVWFDSHGNILTIGCFRGGQPYSGSFLNWSHFTPPQAELGEFEWDYYARDWISLFEAAFDSTTPDYRSVLECYLRGAKL